MSKQNKPFQFEISLSVLNHLGRNLYRNFITVLGEAISNSWDADAKNVWIYIDKENNSFVIKDDGIGMTSVDFQKKFLTVGYSKRKEGDMLSGNKRPYIGAKGIGKLALLSCAERVNIVSKTADTDYVGGIIDNSGLTEAIKQEIKPDEYSLEQIDMGLFNSYTEGHNKGTIVYFEQTKENIRNSVPYLKKLIALYFRFSLIDKGFNIYVNGELVTFKDIKGLAETTEFLWNINDIKDPYIDGLISLKSEIIKIYDELKIVGFIATVSKPRDLKITGTEEKVGVDLFVNGRLREKDILKHIPTARVVENYLYGQIHFDELDSDGNDRFTSSREGVLENDEKYKKLLKELKTAILPKILDEWDRLRLARGEDGDDENGRKDKKARRARSLYSLSSREFTEDQNETVQKWVKELLPEAEFNIPAYVDCFLSENLVRKFIKENKLPLESQEKEYTKWRKREDESKSIGNLSIDIRSDPSDLFYLSMKPLVDIIESPCDGKPNNLLTDEKQFTPIRDALMHTSLLTNEAKIRLTTIFDNIKGRLKRLLRDVDSGK